MALLNNKFARMESVDGAEYSFFAAGNKAN